MEKIICKTYEEMSALAAHTIALQVRGKPNSVLGLATGSTPIGTYKRLAELYEDGFVDFSKVITFNLDEYFPIKKENSQSYDFFMNDNLFKFINLPRENINIPNGECGNIDDAERECIEYDKRLCSLGGTDLQLLGIGNNGHIAFVEPAETLPLSTSVVTLTEDTIEANSRFFEDGESVPRNALSMGLRGILSSRHILLLISGKAKAPIVKKLFSDDSVSTLIPASLLKLHPNVTVIMDSDAASLLK